MDIRSVVEGVAESRWRHGDLPTSHPEALAALLDVVSDHRLAREILARVDSYGQLASMRPHELAHTVGPWAAHLRVPRLLRGKPARTLSSLPGGRQVQLVGVADRRFPGKLRDRESAPVLIEVVGDIPSSACIAVGGTRWPSHSGWLAARAAAEAVARCGATVVAVVDGGTGEAALSVCVEAKARAVAVSPYPLWEPGVDDLVLEGVVDAGGAAVHIYGSFGSEEAYRGVADLTVGLSEAVVLAEVGLEGGSGAALARAAVASGSYLIVPAPAPDILTPVEVDGGNVLARPRRFSAEWFGTSAEIDSRVSEGLPAADAVVGDVRQLERTIMRVLEGQGKGAC